MAQFGLMDDDVPTNSAKATPATANAGGNTGASGGGGTGGSGGGWGGVPATASSQVASGQGGGYQGGGGGGLKSGSGGNFIEGVGNYLGFGKPTTIGGVEGPKLNRDDYFVGGSQGASQGLMDASMGRANAFGGRAGPGLRDARANAYLSRAGALGGDEAALTKMLQDRAAGRGPSVAVDTYTKGAQDATQRAQSLATSARGGAGLLGARQAAETGFQGAQDAALQGGMIRKQEMQEAAGLLGQQLAARNQAELARGGLGLDIARAGADVGQRQLALNDAAQNAELSRYMQLQGMNQQGLMGYNAQQGGFDLDAARINAGIDTTNLGQQNAQDAKRGGFIKNAMGIIGGPVGGVLGGLFAALFYLVAGGN